MDIEGYKPPTAWSKLASPACTQCDKPGCKGNLLHGRLEGGKWQFQLKILHHKTGWSQNAQPITLVVPEGELMHRLLVQYVEVRVTLLIWVIS